MSTRSDVHMLLARVGQMRQLVMNVLWQLDAFESELIAVLTPAPSAPERDEERTRT